MSARQHGEGLFEDRTTSGGHEVERLNVVQAASPWRAGAFSGGRSTGCVAVGSGRGGCARCRGTRGTVPRALIGIGHLGLQPLGELANEFAAHVRDHATAELGHPAGQRQVGVDGDLSTVALRVQLHVDRGGRISLSADIAALRPDDRVVSGVVALGESCDALVLGSDRADLDFDCPVVVLALDAEQGSAR